MNTIEVIEKLGGLTAVARICGVRPPSVHAWKTTGIPASRCEQIEVASGGTVRCEDIRPDLEWHRDPQGRAFYRTRLPEASTNQTPEARAA